MEDINYPSPPIARRIRGPNGRMPTSTYGTSNHYVYYGLPNKRKTTPRKQNATSKCAGKPIAYPIGSNDIIIK